MTVTPNKPQMKAGTARGRAPGVMYRLTPAAHQAQGRAHMRFAGSCRIDLPLTLPRNTGRELRALGIFSAEGRDCNPSLAKISHSQASGAVQGFSDLPEFHSSNSSVRRRLDSHDANENGLTHAQTSFAPGAKAHD